MEIVALVLIFYFFIGAAVCLLICVNPRDPGLLGKLRGFVFETLPNIFTYVSKYLVLSSGKLVERGF